MKAEMIILVVAVIAVVAVVVTFVWNEIVKTKHRGNN